jgi:hypothetical protein
MLVPTLRVGTPGRALRASGRIIPRRAWNERHSTRSVERDCFCVERDCFCVERDCFCVERDCFCVERDCFYRQVKYE